MKFEMIKIFNEQKIKFTFIIEESEMITMPKLNFEKFQSSKISDKLKILSELALVIEESEKLEITNRLAQLRKKDEK